MTPSTLLKGLKAKSGNESDSTRTSSSSDDDSDSTTSNTSSSEDECDEENKESDEKLVAGGSILEELKSNIHNESDSTRTSSSSDDSNTSTSEDDDESDEENKESNEKLGDHIIAGGSLLKQLKAKSDNESDSTRTSSSSDDSNTSTSEDEDKVDGNDKMSNNKKSKLSENCMSFKNEGQSKQAAVSSAMINHEKTRIVTPLKPVKRQKLSSEEAGESLIKKLKANCDNEDDSTRTSSSSEDGAGSNTSPSEDEEESDGENEEYKEEDDDKKDGEEELTANTQMGFGKHRDKTYGEVVEQDFKYVKWAKNVKNLSGPLEDFVRWCNTSEGKALCMQQTENESSKRIRVTNRSRAANREIIAESVGNERFPFGQHKNESFREIAESDPSYHLRYKDMNDKPNAVLDRYIKWFNQWAPRRFEAHAEHHRDLAFAVGIVPCVDPNDFSDEGW